MPWQWFGHALAGNAITSALQARDGPNKAAVIGAAALWGTAPLVMGVQASKKKYGQHIIRIPGWLHRMIMRRGDADEYWFDDNCGGF